VYTGHHEEALFGLCNFRSKQLEILLELSITISSANALGFNHIREVQVEVLYISRCETRNQSIMQLSVKDKQIINTRKEKVTAKEYVLMQTFEKECDKLTLDSNIGTSLE
jgi:hypothetical protein